MTIQKIFNYDIVNVKLVSNITRSLLFGFQTGIKAWYLFFSMKILILKLLKLQQHFPHYTKEGWWITDTSVTIVVRTRQFLSLAYMYIYGNLTLNQPHVIFSYSGEMSKYLPDHQSI